MESVGLNLNAANIPPDNSKITEEPSLNSSGSIAGVLQIGALSTLRQIKVDVLIPPGQELIDEINSYQGYQFDADKGWGSDALIYQDKKTVFDGSDPYNPQYFEVASVFYKGLSEEDNQAMVQQIMENKLDPSAAYNYFQEGSNSASGKLEYGISPFDWKTMRGMAEEDTFQPGDAKDALKDTIVNHAFSANGTVTTNSGNEIKFSFDYQEQNRLPSGFSISGAQESFSDFEARIFQQSEDLKNGPKSEEDYRAINFTFSSASPLTKDEADGLNKLAQSIMKTADQASKGIMDKQGYDLRKQFSEIENLFKAIEINGEYQGAAQEDTDYKVSILNGVAETNLNIDPIIYEKEYNASRFWVDK